MRHASHHPTALEVQLQPLIHKSPHVDCLSAGALLVISCVSFCASSCASFYASFYASFCASYLCKCVHTRVRNVETHTRLLAPATIPQIRTHVPILTIRKSSDARTHAIIIVTSDTLIT